MIIGFTGTRSGMTFAQRRTVESLIANLIEETKDRSHVGLHGDCIGADSDFDTICRALGLETKCRPCTLESMRAMTPAVEIAEPDSPMRRNRAIVADADRMIACPPNTEPIKRGSGTWATIGFATKAGKPLWIVWPDGTAATSVEE